MLMKHTEFVAFVGSVHASTERPLRAFWSRTHQALHSAAATLPIFPSSPGQEELLSREE